MTYTVYNLPKHFKFYNSCNDVIEVVQDSTYTYLWKSNEALGAISASDIAEHLNNGIYKFIEENTKENIMNALEQAQAKVKELEALLKQAQEEEAEAAKKKEESKIGIMTPEIGDKYHILGRNGVPYINKRSDDNSKYYLASMASTNKAQYLAFQEALCVMAELRTQDGIVVPDGNKQYYAIGFNVAKDYIMIHGYFSLFPCMAPIYKTEELAQKAIDNVGKERIINAFKTLMFISPESRGEITND